jgi:O-antigen/teichoic acid export membrane protein
LFRKMATPRHRDSPPGEGTQAPPASASPDGDAITMARDEVMHRSLAGVFFLTSSSIITLVVGFGASLVLARLLTPADFGVVAVGTTAMLLGQALADGGLGAAMVRRPEPPTRQELRTMNGIQLVLALAVCLPVAAVALGFGRAGAVTAVMILSLPIVTLQTPGRITLSRAMRFDRQAAADTGSQVISLALTVAAVVLGAGVWGLAAGAVIKAVVATVLISRLSGGFQLPSLRGWRGYGSTLLFGVKFQASFYTFLAREQGLNVLLAASAGVGTLGIWTFTNRIFQLPSLAFNSLYVVGFPAMSNMLARGEDIGPILLRIVRRAAIVGTLIFGTFAAASPKLIPAVFGEQWRDVASIIPLMCLSTILLGSISVAASSYLPAVGRPGIVAVASACLGVIWLGVTAAFLPSIGVVAIGIGNLVGAIAEAAVLNAATKRASGVAPYRPLLRPLAVALLAGGIGWLVCVEGPDGFLTSVGAGALTFALAALGFQVVCRRDFADTVGLAFGSLRSAVPRLRRPSAQPA